MARKYTRFDAALQGVEGVPALDDPDDLLVTKGGIIMPAEIWDGEPSQRSIDKDADMSEEEEYSMHLEMGFPRIPKWEDAIDMTQIEEWLLDNANPKRTLPIEFYTPPEYK